MSCMIKIFLGGYVNFLNAQNINCRALSEHLDKDKFKVSTMLFPGGNANDFVPVEGVKYIQQYRPMRLFQWLGWFRGIMTADIAYLPKGELDGFCRILAKLCGTKVFTTLEGVLDEMLLSRMANPRKYIKHFKKYEPYLYSITKYMAKREFEVNSIHCAPEILYLGVEAKRFCQPHDKHSELKNIIFIGNDPIRKNVFEYIECAKQNLDVVFHIVGGAQLESCTIPEYLKQNSITNVNYHGRLDHTQLVQLLVSMDLMFFPSRSEGFPKVHLETACAGVPTLCYSDYGAKEWITTGLDGFVVDTKEEAFAVIADLKAHPEKLKSLSPNAVELGKRFDWNVLVKEWEKIIEKMCNEK